MLNNIFASPYAVPCKTEGNFNDSVLCGASSVPGSAYLKYIPSIPSSHKYGIDISCVPVFNIPIIWKGTPKITTHSQDLIRKLSTLPLTNGSMVTYMNQSKGFYFNLLLKNNLRITITQYEEKWEQGVYVNVILNGEPVIQDFITIDNLIEALKDFYDGQEE